MELFNKRKKEETAQAEKAEMQKGLNSNERKNMEQVRKGLIGAILNFKPNNELTIKFIIRT